MRDHGYAEPQCLITTFGRRVASQIGAAAFAEILEGFVRKIVEPPFAGVLLELPDPTPRHRTGQTTHETPPNRPLKAVVLHLRFR